MEHQIKVWDIFIRSFHWVLVILFSLEFLIDDDFLELHSTIGYIILGLLLTRIIYGFLGSEYARFSNFIYNIDEIFTYVKSVFNFKAKRFIGHNPAGGAMVLILIAALLLTSFTGLLALGFEERQGPLVPVLDYFPFWVFSVAEELHEAFAYVTMLLVIIHVTGVLIESIVHGENLIRSMITGRKNG